MSSNPTSRTNATAVRLIIGLALCALASSSLSAQPRPGSDDGTLFFPPKIKLRAPGYTPRISRSEQRFYSTVPVLPIIFFDGAGSFDIPQRYQVFNSAGDTRDYADTGFVLSNRFAGFMGKYPELLNVVGYRMRHFPETSIQLQGGYSAEPGESPQIAKYRAEIVREYLMNIWDIEGSRIGLLAPRMMCDSADNSVRQEEARRVVILTGDWSLIRPVRFATLNHSLSVLYLDLMVETQLPPEQVERIIITATRDRNRTHAEAVIPGNPEFSTYSFRGMWLPAANSLSENLSFSSLNVTAFVQSTDGTVRESNRISFAVQDHSYGGGEEAQTHIALPFFAWRDTALSDFQLLILNDLLSYLPADEPSFVLLGSTVEASEYDDLDEATIRAVRMRHGERSSGRINGTPVGVEDRLEIFSYSGSETGQSNGYSYDAEFDNVNRGRDQGDEEGSASVDSLERARKRRLDSLGSARIQAIQSILEEHAPDTFTVIEPLMQRGYQINASSLRALPEERWYERNVTLRIHPESGLPPDALQRLKASMSEEKE